MLTSRHFNCLPKVAKMVCRGSKHDAVFLLPYFLGLAPLLELVPLLGLAPPIRLQILISPPVRVGAPPSDKRPLQVSLDFDQKDGEPELFLNQLTSKSLGLFLFIEYSVKYLYAVQKMITEFLKTVSSLPDTEWLSCKSRTCYLKNPLTA